MSRQVLLFFVALALVAGQLAACGATPAPTAEPEPLEASTQAPEATAPPERPVTLRVTGPATELTWTGDELKALGTIDVPYTGKDGTTTTYTGVLISRLLEEAGIPAGAEALILLASDGYSFDLPMADVVGCADCIVAFDPEGGLRSVLPGQAAKAQVKGLAELQVRGGGGAQPAAGIPEGAALKITGNVEAQIGWTEDQFKAMPAKDVQSTNKSGETETYTGVSIADLLAFAKPKADATGLTFVADDGYTAEATLAEILACADCIVSFRSKGGFSTVLPGLPRNLQIKGVIEIQVK